MLFHQLEPGADAVVHRPVADLGDEFPQAPEQLVRLHFRAPEHEPLEHRLLVGVRLGGGEVAPPVPAGELPRELAQRGDAHAEQVFHLGHQLLVEGAVAGIGHRAQALFQRRIFFRRHRDFLLSLGAVSSQLWSIIPRSVSSSSPPFTSTVFQWVLFMW